MYYAAPSNILGINPFVGEGQIFATKDKQICSNATKESSHVIFDRRKRIPTPIYKNGNKNGKKQKGINFLLLLNVIIEG